MSYLLILNTIFRIYHLCFSHNEVKIHRKPNSTDTSPGSSFKNNTSDMYIVNKSRPTRSVSLRSVDGTLGVLQEEDVFTAHDTSPPQKPSLAKMDESFDSDTNLIDEDKLSDDLTSLSMSEHAIHSTGNYTSSEDGMLPLEIQDEIAAIDELTRRADIAEVLDCRNQKNNIEINTR